MTFGKTALRCWLPAAALLLALCCAWFSDTGAYFTAKSDIGRIILNK